MVKAKRFSDAAADQWKLLEWRFGATDTEVMEWFAKYHAPPALE